MHISVCICTYQRQELLKRLLFALSNQVTNGDFDYSIIIVDNDIKESAKIVISEILDQLPVDISYFVEPKRSISYARNKTLEHAKGDAIAFIDDDEIPPGDWLLKLHQALKKYKVAGVFGPVRPFFDSPPPDWLIKSKLLDRPEHRTGYVMPWRECRTGNALIKKSIIEGIGEVFRAEFGAGASDIDLFGRLIKKGHTFIWCNEAPVNEVIPPNRWKRSFMIKRALLRGRLSLLHKEELMINIIKSFIAMPAYLFMLPFLQILGHHYFMMYLIKLCDHTGRLLALVGLNPMKVREM